VNEGKLAVLRHVLKLWICSKQSAKQLIFLSANSEGCTVGSEQTTVTAFAGRSFVE